MIKEYHSLDSCEVIRRRLGGVPSNVGALPLDKATVLHGDDVPLVEEQQTSMEARSLSEGEQNGWGQLPKR